ncbi:hypothetical protein L198_02426 [Cryptococcus wingfieldii CBS 7118]|uniref:Uncharacterized protein n=1 Tax=Cryptococcus wingfieldii CBS 7118 TaxID=1295528 RepID=A0A1E3JRS0_9TREE|nr:hypothetical protein L198_02426 [Cryptococcus wingfieldii CBS 7118]ODO03578.1 hypothetical protein L198_02426 [Cryptococcus wingfieldii CBS 7118]
MSRLALLALASLAAVASAAKSGWGEACSQANTHLDQANYQLVTDCDANTYCNSNNTCAWRGCRRNTYPYGYNDYSFDQLPPLCPTGEFCPDESDHCLTQVPVGSSCQKDRDDECAQPDNWNDLAGDLNTNGSICLQYTCYYANMTVGQTCVNDNTAYTAYRDDGSAYAFIVSRDNCANGHYCDASDSLCYRGKAQGDTCSGNKECLSYNCADDGRCGKAADDVIHPPVWQYVLIGLGIFILIGAVMTTLWFVHRRVRNRNQAMLEQYYNEQIAYRQSIMSMTQAKQTLANLPPGHSMNDARASLYGDMPPVGWTSGAEIPLPPNMRRDSASIYREGQGQGLSEVQLMPHQTYQDASESSSRFRGGPL